MAKLVTVSENVIVAVGRPPDAENGSVYLFTLEGVFIQRIDAPDGEIGSFGSDLSIEGNKLLVGNSALAFNDFVSREPAVNRLLDHLSRKGAAYLYSI